MDVDAGFSKSAKMLVNEVIGDVVCKKGGYELRDVHVFGFGQGGCVALQVAAEVDGELGGAVSVGGVLPSAVSARDGDSKSGTPVLLCKGDRKSALEKKEVERVKAVFRHVEVATWNREGDAMPKNREEMLPIMEFLARRLRSRKGVPEGGVEVGQAVLEGNSLLF